MPRIQNKRGLKANLPATGMLAGELHLTTDRQTAHFALDATTNVPIVPPIDDLANLAAVDGAQDLLIIHDFDEAGGVKEKRITVNDFRSALNIPAASTDELVAITSGGTAGYLFGTDGTDGILRAGDSSLAFAIDGSNGFGTIVVNDIDLGTF